MGVGLTLVGLFIAAVMKGVLGQTWDVTLPQRIVGIQNSCVTVPCSFKVENNQETNLLNCSNAGAWRRQGMLGDIVFTSQNPSSSFLQGEISGNLTKKNCTTVFHNFPETYNDLYFFRLQCPALKFTFSRSVDIKVQTDPSPPRLTVMTRLSEGDLVQLQCSTPVTCLVLPPALTWFPQDATGREETTLLQDSDGQMRMMSTLSFIASPEHHNQTVACSVSYPLSSGANTRPITTSHRLNVEYLPRSTVASLSTTGPVVTGNTVMLTCSSDANPPVRRYVWFRENGRQSTRVGEGDSLVLQVSNNDSGVYVCEVETTLGSQRSGPVSLEIGAVKGNNNSVLVICFIICGAVLVLFFLTVAVDLYKYQSLSSRLKRMEQKENHTYTALKFNHVSDYDQLQTKPKPPAPPAHTYENHFVEQIPNQPQLKHT